MYGVFDTIIRSLFYFSFNQITMKIIIYLLSFLLMFISINSYAQRNIGGIPYSHKLEFINQNIKDEIPVIELTKPDVEKALKEDEGSWRYRFALGIPVNLTMENAGKWTVLENGDRIWRLKIYSSDAVKLFCSMVDFYLPEGSTLYFYDGNHQQIRGGFSSLNNRESKQFIFSPIKTQEFYIEYYEPKESSNKASFTIDRVYYGYR